MGIWGAGNFENDGANDYLVVLLDKLVAEITDNFSPEKMEQESFLEEYGEFHIIPAIDIYITLSEQYDIPPKIERDVTNRWRTQYLYAYDNTTAMYKDSFKLERRKVLETTFNRLDDLISDWANSI